MLVTHIRNEYESELESLKAKIDEQDQTVEYLNDVIKNAQAEADKIASENKEKIIILESQVEKTEEQFKNLQSEVEQLLQSNETLKTEADTFESKIEGVRGELTEKLSEIHDLQCQIGSVTSDKFEISAARERAESDLASRISDIESDRDAKMIEKSALELSLRNLQEEKNQLQMEINRLYVTQADMTANFDQTRKNMEESLENITSERDNLISENEFLGSKIDQAQLEINNLNDKTARLEDAELEIELLSQRYEEMEESFNKEREIFEELLQKSKDDLMNLASAYEIFNLQLSEKDEQVKQLIRIKGELEHFISDNEKLKIELQVQYEKISKNTEELETKNTEIAAYQRKLGLYQKLFFEN